MESEEATGRSPTEAVAALDEEPLLVNRVGFNEDKKVPGTEAGGFEDLEAIFDTIEVMDEVEAKRVGRAEDEVELCRVAAGLSKLCSGNVGKVGIEVVVLEAVKAVWPLLFWVGLLITGTATDLQGPSWAKNPKQ